MLDRNGNEIKKIDGFNSTTSICVDEFGNWLVCDFNQHQIQILDINGDVTKKIGTYGTNNGDFKNPQCLDIFANKFYVADGHNNRIQVFDKNWNFISDFRNEGSQQLKYPTGICIDGEGKIFITEHLNNRIQIFNNNWKFLGSFQIDKPVYAAIDSYGDIILTTQWAVLVIPCGSKQ